MKPFLCLVVATLMLGNQTLVLGAPPQAAAASSIQLTGKVEAKGGKYQLRDEKTRMTYELRGTGLQQYAGKKVSVKGQVIPGAVLTAGISNVVQVDQIDDTSRAGAAAAAAGAGGAVGAGATAGLSAATIGVIVGVAGVGGTLGGLYASGAIGKDEPASRP